MQTIKLNLIPGSVLPVVNASQYDAHRQFALQVYEGAYTYDLTGKTVEIRGTKPDGNGFAYDAQDGVVSVSGNTVTISTTQQMTAVGGQTMAELRITSGDTILGTINFILDVEHSALSDDTPISETDIPVIERDMQEALDQAEAAADDAEEAASHYPYIDPDNKHWMAWDVENQTWYDTGVIAEGNAGDYSQLLNKPQINSVTLSGNKSAADLGLATDAVMTGASAGSAGAKGLVPAPAAGDQDKVLYGDGTWKTPTGGSDMTGATASTPGTHGLVPAPAAGDNTKFLRGDGTWAEAGGGGGTTIVQIPSVVVGTYTYTGSAQGPTITGLDTAHTVVTGDTATNVGSYTLTIALADPQTMVWSDLTTADKTYSWSIGKAPGAVTLSKNTVVLSNSVPSDTVAISNATGSISITSDDTSVATVSPSTMSASGGTLTVTGAGAGTATVTVSVAASSNYNATSETISVTNSMANHIYGAVWDGSADTSWTRTDDAASFADPQPYYAGMGGTPSSPFDSIQPWAGMVRSTDANAGEVVAIPKFYYKLGYASGTTGLKIQIAPAANGAAWATANGYKVSPAHMNRGDGAGERDVVYVSRYHCASDFRSKTGVTPKNNTTKATFRSGISALGTNVWQWDYAMLATIHMLYLVEFADWDSQRKIGYGCGNNSSVQSMGYTDNMPYHTGTSLSSKTSYGLGTQYRNIEGLWDNCFDFVDGFIFSSNDIYIIKNPASFSDNISDGVFIGSRAANGYIQAMDIPTVSGYEWAIYPSAIGGSDSTYTCDFNDISNGSDYVTGCYYSHYLSTGFFYMSNRQNSGNQYGSRLMILP